VCECVRESERVKNVEFSPPLPAYTSATPPCVGVCVYVCVFVCVREKEREREKERSREREGERERVCV